MLTIGIDLGPTTVKYALLTEDGCLAAEDRLRHASAVRETWGRVLTDLARRTPS